MKWKRSPRVFVSSIRHEQSSLQSRGFTSRSSHRRYKQAAVVAAGSRDVCVAHRLCQRRKSFAREWRFTSKRDGDSHGTRRIALASRCGSCLQRARSLRWLAVPLVCWWRFGDWQRLQNSCPAIFLVLMKFDWTGASSSSLSSRQC